MAVGIAVVGFGTYAFRHRFVKANAEMLRYLPVTLAGHGVTTFYVDVAALRRAGALSLVTGSTVGDSEYQGFVRQTQFDYSKDLDALAGATDGELMFSILRGRFNWARLRSYATGHGGNCEREICTVPTSRQKQFLSFTSIQPDVLSIALSPERFAVTTIDPPGHPVRDPLPTAPVWVRVSETVLKNPGTLPAGLRIFAISLQSAESVILSLGPAPSNGPAAFRLELDAQCQNRTAADTMRTQLDIDTKLLKLELTRERAKASDADLTGLLTEGSFQVIEKRVLGTWPVKPQLVKALQ